MCGIMFYVGGNAARDTVRKQGTYCSRACKNRALTGRERVQATSYVRKDGYRTIKVGIRQYKLEHRLIMETALGRTLTRREEVHHLNGDKLDNRRENLVVVSPSEHQALHPDFGQRMQRRVELVCLTCGRPYTRKRSRAAESNYCSALCRMPAMWAGRRAAAASRRT